MDIISLDGVSKALGGPLFSAVNLSIQEDERLGLVGPNGSGKSSLLSLLSGDLLPDEGRISRRKSLRVSVLPQAPEAGPGTRLSDFFLEGSAPGLELIRAYEAALEASHADHSAAAQEGLGELSHRMEAEGGFLLFQRYASLCAELGLQDQDADMGTFSGGMVKKAALARALAEEADLLLLDEPTNHLDIESIEWLEQRLAQSRGAFVVVTHDRSFLDAACSGILEIDRGGLYRYSGGWSTHLEKKAERWKDLLRADDRRKAILKIEMKWLMRGARARAGKSERRKELIRGMQSAALEEPERMGSFSSASRRLGGKVLKLEGAAKSFGGRTVIAPLDYEFSRGERIGVVGPNGSGKTTFLRIVTGELAPDGGLVDRGETVSFSTFGQTAAELRRDISVLDYVRERAETIDLGEGQTISAEQLLERFLFDRERQGQKASSLSGGEARRLQLVRLLAEAPNFLVLDEPTNDLDIETIELVEDWLEGFKGCLLVVSHDRTFLDRVTDSTFIFDGCGRVEMRPGSYSDWRAARDAKAADASPSGAGGRSAASDAPKGAKSSPSAKRKPSFKERQEYEGILPRIEALEAEKAALEGSFATAGAHLAEASRRYAEVETELSAALARWEELAALIEG